MHTCTHRNRWKSCPLPGASLLRDLLKKKGHVSKQTGRKPPRFGGRARKGKVLEHRKKYTGRNSKEKKRIRASMHSSYVEKRQDVLVKQIQKASEHAQSCWDTAVQNGLFHVPARCEKCKRGRYSKKIGNGQSKEPRRSSCLCEVFQVRPLCSALWQLDLSASAQCSSHSTLAREVLPHFDLGASCWNHLHVASSEAISSITSDSCWPRQLQPLGGPVVAGFHYDENCCSGGRHVCWQTSDFPSLASCRSLWNWRRWNRKTFRDLVVDLVLNSIIFGVLAHFSFSCCFKDDIYIYIYVNTYIYIYIYIAI